ncbi:MAG TPA: gliding motility-associated C-terminal domain-containing protein, partial [Saprospiraceae bacterium]|nr:gliding motility-associated C-terminal domain-containing protein [Saprospiraceae bacterium]
DTMSTVLTTCNPAEAGMDTLQLLNQFGCDSIVFRQIDLLRRDTLQEEFFVCEASDVGTDTLVFTKQVGCDSIRILQFRYVGVDTNLLEGEICEGEQLEFEGLTLEQAGRYCVDLTSIYGCDSVRCLDLEVQPTYQNLDTDTICQGAFSIYRGDTLRDSGFYEYNFSSTRGCDSTIIFQLVVTNPPPFSQIGPEPYCEGEQAIVRFQSVDSFNLQWLDEPLAELERNFDAPGVYRYRIRFAESCFLQDSVIIPEPIILSFELDSISDYNGFNVSCPENSDGFISLNGGGGLNPVQYEWSAGNTGLSANNLQAGLYFITMTDNAGCRDSLEVELTAPPPINYQLETQQINCQNEQGAIAFSALSGGIPPFDINLNSQASDTASWSALSAGTYLLELEDANGCSIMEEVMIEDQTDSLFLRIIGPDTVRLGDQLRLTYVSDDPMTSWEWSAPEQEDCLNCQFYEFQPTFSQMITLEGLNQQGCTARVNQSIAVQLIYEVYIPNAFSPNGDANNDFHVVYGNASVDRILNYQVFSRWGSKVFENENLLPGISDGFWDGTFNGKIMNPGVFVYVAEVRFIDGNVKVFSGDVTLFR